MTCARYKFMEQQKRHNAWSEFRKVAGSRVDSANKTISASVSHLSIYAVMGKLVSTVAGFRVRPNPWNVSKDPKPAIVYNLPDNSEIAVYSAATDEKVRTLHPNNQTDVEWDGTNDEGRPVAPAVYLLHLNSPNGEKTIKLSLIR